MSEYQETECIERTGKTHEPDAGKACWCGMIHVPAAPGLIVEPAGGYPADGEPDGAYINADAADDGVGTDYTVTLYGTHAGRFEHYGDALDHLRAEVVEQRADPERLPVIYVGHRAHLWLLLPSLDEIDRSWGDVPRPSTPDWRAWFAETSGCISREAFCALCGETCSPNDETEQFHAFRADGVTECGGPLVPLGALIR